MTPDVEGVSSPQGGCFLQPVVLTASQRDASLPSAAGPISSGPGQARRHPIGSRADDVAGNSSCSMFFLVGWVKGLGFSAWRAIRKLSSCKGAGLGSSRSITWGLGCWADGSWCWGADTRAQDCRAWAWVLG